MVDGRFTKEGRAHLIPLDAVDEARTGSLVCSERFREECMRRCHEGERPGEIFAQAGLPASLTGYDPSRIIGSSTGLDSARLRSQISLACNLDPKSINAYMIGEHGASMLAAWKSASISGKPLAQLADEEPERFAFDLAEMEDKARQDGYVTFAGKQCTKHAVANAAVRVVAAVLHDEHAVMGASILMTGQYGEEGIFTSLPCIIGRNGVKRVMELDLSQAELEAFHASCQHIRDNISRLTPDGRA